MDGLVCQIPFIAQQTARAASLSPSVWARPAASPARVHKAMHLPFLAEDLLSFTSIFFSALCLIASFIDQAQPQRLIYLSLFLFHNAVAAPHQP